MKLIVYGAHDSILPVAPFTGAGIETNMIKKAKQILAVAPFTGAGIETMILVIGDWVAMMLPPSRGQELKHSILLYIRAGPRVAPFTGAGIETLSPLVRGVLPSVAPFTGAGIETIMVHGR